MNGLRLRLRRAEGPPVDMSPLTPERLQGLSRGDIAGLRLQAGNRRRRVDELFELDDGDEDRLTVAAAAPRLHRIGAAMRRGRLHVEGHAGLYCGLAMQGGELLVDGDCADYAGAAMAGGRLSISGRAGARVGGTPDGERVGMRGGVLRVGGPVGPLAGDRLRRGLLLLEGGAGDALAARMIAGTVLVLGPVGADLGLGMRRGTVWLSGPAELPATFNPNGVRRLGFLALLTRELNALGGGFVGIDLDAPVQRWLGDRGCDGRGEVLCPA